MYIPKHQNKHNQKRIILQKGLVPSKNGVFVIKRKVEQNRPYLAFKLIPYEEIDSSSKNMIINAQERFKRPHDVSHPSSIRIKGPKGSEYRISCKRFLINSGSDYEFKDVFTSDRRRFIEGF